MSALAATPRDVIRLFAERLSAGDVQSALELYEPDASFAPEPGGVALEGLGSIGDALGAFAALKPAVTADVQWVQEAGAIALVLNRWTLDGRDGDGAPVQLVGRAADVLRRGPDGGWRFAIDFPWLEP